MTNCAHSPAHQLQVRGKVCLPSSVTLAHLAVLDERLVNQFGFQRDLARFFQSGRPVERLVQRLTDGETSVSA